MPTLALCVKESKNYVKSAAGSNVSLELTFLTIMNFLFSIIKVIDTKLGSLLTQQKEVTQ